MQDPQNPKVIWDDEAQRVEWDQPIAPSIREQRQGSVPGRLATGLATGMVRALNPIPLVETLLTDPGKTLSQIVETYANPLAAVRAGKQIGQRARTGIQTGQAPEAVGELLGTLGTTAAAIGLPALGKKGVIPVRSYAGSERQAAIDAAQARGVPIDLAQRTQNPLIQGVRDIIGRLPGSAGPAAEFRRQQQASVSAIASNLRKEVSPAGTPWKVKAGELMEERLTARGQEFRSQVNRATNDLLRIAEERANTPVRVGEAGGRYATTREAITQEIVMNRLPQGGNWMTIEELRSAVPVTDQELLKMANAGDVVLGAWDGQRPVSGPGYVKSGDNIYFAVAKPRETSTIALPGRTAAPPAAIPKYEMMAAPVYYKQIKADIAPVVAEMERAIPAAQREASPGLAILRQIMARGEAVPLETALQDLQTLNSNAKSLMPYARNVSQGKAIFGAGTVRRAIREVVEGLGPDAVKLYEERIAGTVGRKQAAEVQLRAFGRGEVTKSPVQAVRYFTAPEDQNVIALRFLARNAPEQLPDLATSHLDSIVRAVQDGRMGWKRAYLDFQKLGPETKATLYGSKATGIGDFLRFASMMGDVANPSGTAVVGTIGVMGTYVVRHPILGAAYLLSARQMARVMYAPGGAQLLAEGMRLPFQSAMANTIATAILANAGIKEAQELAATQETIP